MNCDIKVISPVHIGSGEKYGPSEYLYFNPNPSKKDKFAFKRININKYYKHLLDLDDKEECEEFLACLSDSVPFGDYKNNISKKFTRYTLLNKCEKKPVNTEIDEIIKTFDKAYIPGSSIKGAIKTAILFNLMDFDSVNEINNFIYKIKNNRSFNKEENRFFDKFLTSPMTKNSRNRRISPPQRNIFKFLQVSDSTYAKQISLHDYHIKMARINKNIKSNYIYKNNNDGILYLETIDRGANLSFEINNNFDEKFYSGLKFDKNVIELIDIENIKSNIYEFSKKIIKFEMEFCKEYGFNDLYKFYAKNKNYNKENAPLLKLGGGSGFLATTIGLKIKDNNDFLYSKIIEYKDAYEFCFPKSRKITRLNERPLGWIQLNFKDK